MTTYRYQGLSTSGAQIEGVVEAFDKADAVAKARENCRVLLNVEPVSAGKFNDIMNADLGTLIGGGNGGGVENGDGKKMIINGVEYR